MKVAIIGKGWVGKAMLDLFPDAYVYSHGKTTNEGTKEEVNKCDIAFICVPTPNMPEGYNTNGGLDDSDEGYPLHEGKLDTSAIEEVVSWCKCQFIVIRSTVNPGTTDHLINKYNKKIVMQPEYLGETPSHPMLDQKLRQFLVIGGEVYNRKVLIDLYATVYNANINIRQVSAYEAEVIKLSENRAIAYKVAECQELYDVCLKDGLDYYTIRDAVYGDDPRFNLWWSFVYPDKRGFNSKCIPKDVYAWCAWAESAGYEPKITRALLEKNKEWLAENEKDEKELINYYKGK
jgi:UDPglucose 6-dehydrogenase